MSATIDQQFIEYIVKTLVSNPDQVKVERTIDERGVLLQLHVSPEDLGRVIGRNGTTAKSIRILLRALGVKNDARYNLKIVDTGDGQRERRDDQRDESVASASEGQSQAQDDVAVDEPADEPQPEPEPEAEPESGIDRHREDLKDLTDLDI